MIHSRKFQENQDELALLPLELEWEEELKHLGDRPHLFHTLLRMVSILP